MRELCKYNMVYSVTVRRTEVTQIPLDLVFVVFDVSRISMVKMGICYIFFIPA